MEKSVKTYLVDPDITLMSLVELGANYTQAENGKTILLMKSAKHDAQENSTGKEKEMTELEARKRALELELAQVNDEISKEKGEVAGGEKPAGAGESQAKPEETVVTEPADNNAQAPDLQGKVTELEAALEAKNEEISGLQADNKKLQSTVDAYYTALAPKEPEGDG